jgi:spermidine synthase
MSWIEIATETQSGGQLALYRGGDGVFMIRANGLELMNGRCHRSEDALGAMAGQLARRGSLAGDARLLIGGLGLGFTVAAALRALDGAGSITVAEISAAVIEWYERYFEPTLLGARPANLGIVQADVAALLREAPPASYDAIVLDVDNGPEPLAVQANEYLYCAEGLGRLKSALRPGGVLLIWSGFAAPAFCARAEAAGFEVCCERISIPDRPELFHYIYQLANPPSSPIVIRAIAFRHAVLP